ncbi:asparagine--tRNA ligase [Candidatus Babeliales bacterium]|nr:asparagine--tRNA ligase [Candidatus Babeliales bacterium]
MRTKINQISHSYVGKAITIKGWAKSLRDQKTFAFININDGSTLSGFQVVLDESTKDFQEIIKTITTGTALSVTGTIVESPGKGQSVELKATEIEVVGTCPTEGYPLQKKRHSFEFLRTMAHLRPRTNTIGAVTRVRNALAKATHDFFQEKGFLYIHTPIITSSDCEGAGQMFRATTMNLENLPRTSTGKIDNSKDFFGKPAFLTVSGQLNVEAYTCALGDTYTFGPTFRAENSNTSRHLAEFWMIEPEIAFADLNDDANCAEQYFKYVIKHVLDSCQQDIEFFNKFIDKTLLQRLEHVEQTSFKRLPYTDAIKLLEASNRTFEFDAAWGKDLHSEHERYLAEEYFKKPVILTDYPKDIKSFYMRMNEDSKTVAAMDILVAGVGEIAGGSQREERLDVLISRMEELDLCQSDYEWYLDLRRFGSIPHAGFGVGFERLVQFATGMENIRDVIPFPRYPGHAEF